MLLLLLSHEIRLKQDRNTPAVHHSNICLVSQERSKKQIADGWQIITTFSHSVGRKFHPDKIKFHANICIPKETSKDKVDNNCAKLLAF